MGWGGGIGLIQLGLELEASRDRERGTGSVMGTRLRAPACTCVHLRAGHRCRASEPEVWSALVVGGRKEKRKKKKGDFSYSIPAVLSHCTFVLARYWFSGHSGDQWKAHSRGPGLPGSPPWTVTRAITHKLHEQWGLPSRAELKYERAEG